MVTASKKKQLTIDAILSMVSEYQIFRWYLGKDFKIGRPLHSPFHKDDNPSFSIMATAQGRLFYTDFARTEFRGTPVDFVMQLHSLTYPEALVKIDKDMGLGIQGKKSDYKAIVSTFKEPKIEKLDTFIQVTAKPFDSQDLAYWNQYHIDLADLKAHNVYSVKRLYINRQRASVPITDLCFGFLLGESWKIYRPLAKKVDKWKSNIPIDKMWGVEHLDNGCTTIVVTKALKDMIVLKKFLPYVAAVQNESTVSINNQNIEKLQKNCGQVYLNFDSDEPGVNSCSFYNQYGFKWVNCPKDHAPVKDFADLAKEKGMDTVIRHFMQKGII